jgi:uncharacterized repeat protein (TIGR03806 family)
MAFHPEFRVPGSTNRNYVYVYYNYSPNPVIPGGNHRPPSTTKSYNRLSRFTVPDGSLLADPNSELVLINQYDLHLWHNGGGMFFRPDGFLYLINGDEGGADDNYSNSQKLDSGLFSGVLRIDVDQNPNRSHPIRRQPLSGATPATGWPPSYSSNYFIPNDNPWVNPDGSVLEEFWAIGFRSPHRMTFDPVTGQIWNGDVGQADREEVNLVVRGGNYQWAYREGTITGPKSMPGALIGTDQPPVHDYPHADGNSCVIGGYVYRGSEHAADLYGKYVFGDNFSGRIWTLTYNPTGPSTVSYLCNMPAGQNYTGLSSFGVDQNDEIYMCQMGANARIWKLARSGTPTSQPPVLLSQTGVFTNLATLSPRAGLIPFEVNSPLWSDGAVKQRWIAVPNNGAPYDANEQVSFASTGEWSFPNGTVLVKHFELPVNQTNANVRKRLETRFLVRGTNGSYYGVTYKWRADNSDADLLTTSLSESIPIITPSGTRTQTWYYPSQQECLSCHTLSAGSVLGVKTRQLNGNFSYPATGRTDNQLRTWNHLGLLNPAINEADIANYDRLVAVSNISASLEHRARSYLDANCAQCHRPQGVPANFDARFDTLLADQNIVNGPVNNTLGITGAMEVAPGSLSQSIMYLRLNTNGSIKMPPLARNLVDSNAVAVLASWINSMGIPPSILSDPRSQMVAQGSTVSFSVTAQGDSPVRYQWQFNGTNISAATNTTLQLSSVAELNEGNYLAVVTNAVGSATSQMAHLTVNVPPALTPVTDRAIHQGMTLTVVQPASDLDTPPNVLTFALANAPTGAAINATNGTITWTPAPDQVNTTNVIAAFVTDDGVPNLSATNTFTVTVVSRPVIQSIIPVAGGLNITWSSIPGINYRLQYQTNLNPAVWNNTSNIVLATAGTATNAVPPPSKARLFYRVQVLP